MQFDYKTFIDAIWFERRDIISDGFDKSLYYIQGILPEMRINKYKSGSEAWTWYVPEKWSVKNAYIKNGKNVLLDLKDHPLHVMSYSTPISGKISKKELMDHLHYRPEYPDAIPFEFSYYNKKWGFCIESNKLCEFNHDEYEVLIDSKFEPGELKVGEIYIPGAIDKEIVIMAHLCHPCMVDDGLSGVAALVSIAKNFLSRPKNRYSYRFLILPETIGSITYLSHNEHLIDKMEFGIFLEMLGHDDIFSLQKSKQDTTLIDKAAEICLKESNSKFRLGKFRTVIKNDEKVLNGPGVNVPTISISRSKFRSIYKWPYPQYHSSADTPDIISIERIKEAENIIINILEILDKNYCPKAKVKGPIFLTRYGMWIDNKELSGKMQHVSNYLHDGQKSLIEIAYELDLSYKILEEWLDKFFEHNLIEKRDVLCR